MTIQELTRTLKTSTPSKIVLLVSDGIGGLPLQPDGPTELEAAATPNLDALARHNVCGLSIPILHGITPGSGPGHLGLFGYDPLETTIGRGVLEALGIDLELGPTDVAARGNFCTVNEDGQLVDRRAGRIPTEASTKLVEKLRHINIPGIDLVVEPVREHRFAVVFKGQDLYGDVNDTDPQVTGVPALPPTPRNVASERMASIAAEFIRQAATILKDDRPANMLMLRGFARKPPIPSMQELYGVRAAAIAVYPMYRGLARLVGMDVLPAVANLGEQIQMLRDRWNDFDFFFLHYKYTDSTGEDGNFAMKVKRIEELDARIPDIVALNPDVLLVTGDHSTPAVLKSHSWHPVPVLLAAKTCRPDRAQTFGERECLMGGLGQFKAKYLLPIALGHAGKLQKFGA